MTPQPFVCALAKDHNPPLDPEADKYYQQAKALTKQWREAKQMEALYEKAVALNHWKAMYNLSIVYMTGKYQKGDEPDHPTLIKKDIDKMLALHYKMVELKIPLGYYTWAMDINRGYVKGRGAKEAALYFDKAVQLGYPLALVSMGNHYSFGLPRGSQQDDIADQYFKCAGRQDNAEALIEVASFYKIAKKNNPLAAYFYQKAASLGSNKGLMAMEFMFEENQTPGYNLGYPYTPELQALYADLRKQLHANPDLTFPNLMKDHPLPRHPTQGYDADNPDVRPDY